ncbi:S4 domain-containing protein, partial [Candidatus Saccharibacteria bacterium]|nr:S4 domain-containing protein [Candidatus Saccharibacteria bacterium]
MRLNKFIATATGKSRREADQLIAAGRVRVNSQVAILGMQVDLPIDPANLTLTNHPDQTPPRDPGLAPNRQTVDDEAKRGGDGIERRM